MKDHVKDEQVVKRQHPLQHVSAGPVESGVMTVAVVHVHSEGASGEHPEDLLVSYNYLIVVIQILFLSQVQIFDNWYFNF